MRAQLTAARPAERAVGANFSRVFTKESNCTKEIRTNETLPTPERSLATPRSDERCRAETSRAEGGRGAKRRGRPRRGRRREASRGGPRCRQAREGDSIL